MEGLQVEKTPGQVSRTLEGGYLVPSDLFLPHSGKQAAARHMHPGQCLEINFTSSIKTKASRYKKQKTTSKNKNKQQTKKQVRRLKSKLKSDMIFNAFN